MGLEENSDDTICRGRSESGIAVPVDFCLLDGLGVVDSSTDFSANGSRVASARRTGLLPVYGPVVWSFLRRYSALFFAASLSFQRPPRKIGLDCITPSSIEKFISKPSSAIVCFGFGKDDDKKNKTPYCLLDCQIAQFREFRRSRYGLDFQQDTDHRGVVSYPDEHWELLRFD